MLKPKKRSLPLFPCAASPLPKQTAAVENTKYMENPGRLKVRNIKLGQVFKGMANVVVGSVICLFTPGKFKNQVLLHSGKKNRRMLMEKDQEEGEGTRLMNPKPRGSEVVWRPGIAHGQHLGRFHSTYMGECKLMRAWLCLFKSSKHLLC